MNSLNYKEDDVKTKLLIAIENSGVELPKTNAEDIDLVNFIYDSVQFVSMVVNIEEEFDIVLPDEFLIIDNFHSISGMTQQLIELIEENCVYDHSNN